MSGIDEQKIECPFCKKEPDYWICNFEVGQCWLLSDRYMETKPFKRHVVYESRLRNGMPKLDEIETIRCYCTHRVHVLRDTIYTRILRKMKEFRAKEGVCFNGSGGTEQ